MSPFIRHFGMKRLAASPLRRLCPDIKITFVVAM
jgi:hypothetical protein